MNRNRAIQKGHNSRWFGFEAHGSEGIIALRNSPNGEMYIYRQGMWIPGEENGTWERVLLDEWEQYSAGERTHQSNLIIVRELIQALEEDRPVQACSSGEDGRAALEMIMAVHESQRLGTRVSLPLANRENPYETWRREEERKATIGRHLPLAKERYTARYVEYQILGNRSTLSHCRELRRILRTSRY